MEDKQINNNQEITTTESVSQDNIEVTELIKKPRKPRTTSTTEKKDTTSTKSKTTKSTTTTSTKPKTTKSTTTTSTKPKTTKSTTTSTKPKTTKSTTTTSTKPKTTKSTTTSTKPKTTKSTTTTSTKPKTTKSTTTSSKPKTTKSTSTTKFRTTKNSATMEEVLPQVIIPIEKEITSDTQQEQPINTNDLNVVIETITPKEEEETNKEEVLFAFEPKTDPNVLLKAKHPLTPKKKTEKPVLKETTIKKEVKKKKIEPSSISSYKRIDELVFEDKYIKQKNKLLTIACFISVIAVTITTIFYIINYVLSMKTFVPTDVYLRPLILVVLIPALLFLLTQVIPNFKKEMENFKNNELTSKRIQHLIAILSISSVSSLFISIELSAEIHNLLNDGPLTINFFFYCFLLLVMIACDIIILICMIYDAKINFSTYTKKSDKTMLIMCLAYLFLYRLSFIGIILAFQNIRTSLYVEEYPIIIIGSLIIVVIIIIFAYFFFNRGSRNYFIRHGLLQMELLPVVCLNVAGIIFIVLELILQYMDLKTINFTDQNVIIPIVGLLLTLPVTLLTVYTQYLYKE